MFGAGAGSGGLPPPAPPAKIPDPASPPAGAGACGAGAGPRKAGPGGECDPGIFAGGGGGRQPPSVTPTHPHSAVGPRAQGIRFPEGPALDFATWAPKQQEDDQVVKR